LFVYLLLRGAKHVADTPRKLLLSWLIVPPIIATIISFFIPVYSYFRVLFIILSFVILIASGIMSFKNRLKYGILITVLFIEIFCSLVYLLNPNYQRDNWKSLVLFFRNIQPQIILFESSGTLPPFDYYAGDSLNAKGALKDFPAKDESSVADLGDLLKDNEDVYLVDYLVQISDPNRFVAKKLINLGYKEKDIRDFHGVGFIYHYVK
ncbi:hypothetical protein KKE03_04225, partial [Patescibacteria group bacterium]|nr:hypothetical protein [Patescibacteria group bacterium]